jgi:hypothetical protein
MTVVRSDKLAEYWIFDGARHIGKITDTELFAIDPCERAAYFGTRCFDFRRDDMAALYALGDEAKVASHGRRE